MRIRAKRYWLALTALTIYLNIGWGVFTYYNTFICQHEAQTFWQKLWMGGYSIFNDCARITEEEFAGTFFILILVWVLIPLIALVAWFIWLIHSVLWLIFWGGIFKILSQFNWSEWHLSSSSTVVVLCLVLALLFVVGLHLTGRKKLLE